MSAGLIIQNAISASINRINSAPSLFSQVTTREEMSQMFNHLAGIPADDDAYLTTLAEGNKQLCAAYGYHGSRDDKPFAYSDGVAFIPIHGMLINRFGGYWFGWVTGYSYIRAMHSAALEDPDVKTIVFDVDSGGGEAAGCFELAQDLFEARGQKPTISVIDAFCASAAYALASVADQVYLTPSGYAGSVGVVRMHTSYQKAMEQAGINVEYIYSGDHKVEGNPYEDLPDAVKKSWQLEVDTMRETFVNLVAQNRGLSHDAVYNTEAKVFNAQDALATGLIDRVVPANIALKTFLDGDEGEDDQQHDGDPQQIPDNANAGAVSDKAAAITNTEENIEMPSPTDTQSGAAQPAATNAAVDERTRIRSIMSAAEAEGHKALAEHLAYETEMSAESAIALMAAAAKDQPQQAQQDAPASTAKVFADAMVATQNPNVGNTVKLDAGSDESAVNELINAFCAATGQKSAFMQGGN